MGGQLVRKSSQRSNEPPLVLECHIMSEVPVADSELDAVELLLGAELGQFTK